MIGKDISSHILTIGTDYRPCMGGISVLLNGYSTFFEKFKFVTSSRPGSRFLKIYLFVKSVLCLIAYCLFDKDIRVIHVHTSTFTFLVREKLYVIIGHFFHKKVIVHLHGGTFELLCHDHADEIREVFKSVDVVICVSSYLASVVSKYKLHSNVIVVPNFIEKPKIKDCSKKGGLVTLSFLGVINENKGIFDVINVLGENSDLLRGKIQFLIGGLGESKRLERMIDGYDISDFVHYLGLVKGNDKVKLLNRTDIYIQPSYFESFGISILEAMSYGAAVISSRRGGITEIVPKTVGVLVEPGDKNAILDNILHLIEDEQLRRTLGNQAKKLSSKYYIENTENKLKEVFVFLLNK